MELLLALYLGHLVGDFALQPGWLVTAKRNGWRGLAAHVTIIGLCTVIIVIAQIQYLWGVVILSMAAHLVIEMVTIRLRSRITALSGISVLAIDQGLHVLSLVGIVWIAENLLPPVELVPFGLPQLTAWHLLSLCALAVVTLMGAIIVHEVGNAFGPTSCRREILPFDSWRVAGMIERGAALVLVVAANPAWLAVPFLPRIAYAFWREGDERACHMLAALTGLVICSLGWASIIVVIMANNL